MQIACSSRRTCYASVQSIAIGPYTPESGGCQVLMDFSPLSLITVTNNRFQKGDPFLRHPARVRLCVSVLNASSHVPDGVQIRKRPPAGTSIDNFASVVRRIP